MLVINMNKFPVNQIFQTKILEGNPDYHLLEMDRKIVGILVVNKRLVQWYGDAASYDTAL
jgi:hypothetical protein